MKKEIYKKETRDQKAELKSFGENNLFKVNYLSLVYLIILGIIFIILYNYVYDDKIYLGGDNAVYYITGCSLAEGHGYTNIHLAEQSAANHFPPGYPFIISIIVRFFGESMDVVKKANGVFLFGSIVLLFSIIKKLTKNINLAFVVSLITLLNGHLLQFSFIEMSEVPFTFFILLSIWCFIKTFNKGSSLRQPYFWILAASIIISFYIRSLGICLLIATVMILAINKRWWQIFALTGCFIVAYAPWYIRSENLGGNTYSKQVQMVNPYQSELGKMKISDYPKRFAENTSRYFAKEINSSYSGNYLSDYNLPSHWYDYVISIILILLSLIGIYSLKEFKLYFFFLLSGTFLILMLWPPVWIGIRFMLPIVPLLLFLTIQGALFLLSKFYKKLIKNTVYVNAVPFVFLLFIPVFLPNISQLNIYAKSNYPSNYIDYFELAKWCKNNLPDSAVISTRKPELFYLFANRKVSSYPFIENTDTFLFYLKQHRITNLVAEDLGINSMDRYVAPAINNNLENFKLIKSQNNTNLWQVFYSDSIGYKGDRDTKGKKEGKGLSHYYDGSIYVGDFHENRREGIGKFIFQSGNYYIGEFKDNYEEGNGTMYMKAGGKITGEWKRGSVNGFAIQYDKDGKIINKGIWERNKMIKRE
jgi:4-amino-4-deoxy-L-arabinose transferase-like glycosyltransferase